MEVDEAGRREFNCVFQSHYMKRPVTALLLLAGFITGVQGAELPWAKQHPKGYVAYKIARPLSIDGILDEASWRSAPWTDDFVDIEGSVRPRPRFRTRVKMLWDDSCLYIGAQLQETHVWATLTKRDTVIFYDNDFEVFIDPNGDNHEYYEFEMNARNTVWDLFLPKPYKDQGRPVDSWNIEGLKTAVHVRGTLNNPANIDTGWEVEIAMPWSALKQYAHRPAPPQEGDQWRINFSRVEWQYEVVYGTYQKIKGKPEDNWVWSPQWVVDMHRPETWGYVQFSSRKPGKAKFLADPSWNTRCLLHYVYYAQKQFHDSTKQWAVTLDQLRLDPTVLAAQHQGLSLSATSAGFIVTMPLKLPGGKTLQWHIREDALLSWQ
jgi:hypothetical protein